LPYVLYSDLYDHRDFVRALVNSSFCGLLWTPEIRSADTQEEWVRRMQVVCLSPLAMLNAWMGSILPWSFPEVAPIIRSTIQLRMRLIPYLYSAFARYHFNGTPPFRAMALETGLADDCDSQWMTGDSMLVAPLFAGETSRQVSLPPGAWFDFETGDRYDGGQEIEVAGGLDKLPIFVRDGGIVPLMPVAQSVPGPDAPVPLEVRYYGSAPGKFALYDDDGETFAYERGEYRWRILEASVNAQGEFTGSVSAADDGWRSWYGDIKWRQMGKREQKGQ
jgi:alpha-D-xyloside xylohydrolase